MAKAPVKTDDKKPATTAPAKSDPAVVTTEDFNKLRNELTAAIEANKSDGVELAINNLRDEFIEAMEAIKPQAAAASPAADHAGVAALHEKLDIIIEGLKRSGAIKKKSAPLFQAKIKKG